LKKEQSALFVFAALFGYFMAQTSFPWYVKVCLNFLAASVCAAFTGIFEYLDELEKKP
jgi:hypothetical protein